MENMTGGTARPKECSGELALKTGVAEKVGGSGAQERQEETRMQGNSLFSLSSLPHPTFSLDEGQRDRLTRRYFDMKPETERRIMHSTEEFRGEDKGSEKNSSEQ